MKKLQVLNNGLGICCVLQAAWVLCHIDGDTRQELELEMHRFLRRKGWHSGCGVYPIADPSIPASQAYLDRYNKGGLWDETTEYGRRRIATLEHLNQFLEQMESENEHS